MTPKPCTRCGGTGAEPDAVAIGQALRARRLLAGRQLKEIASVLHISASYLCHLEKGEKMWTEDLIGSYEDALNNVVK